VYEKQLLKKGHILRYPSVLFIYRSDCIFHQIKLTTKSRIRYCTPWVSFTSSSRYVWLWPARLWLCVSCMSATGTENIYTAWW